LAVQTRASVRDAGVAGRHPLRSLASNLPAFPSLSGFLQAIRTHSLTPFVWSSLLIVNISFGIAWTITRQRESLQDLASFLHSAAAYREGLNPYHYYAWLDPPPLSYEALNLNPPISLWLFRPLTGTDETTIHFAFLAGTIAILAAALGLLLMEHPDKRRPLVIISVISFAGVWHTLGYLQIYAPLVLLVVASWYLMRRDHFLLAGVAIGLVIAIKPNFALWPILLLVAGHQRTPLAALGTAALVSAIPLAVHGPTIYRQWLDLTSSFSGLEWTSNASLIAVGSRLGSSQAGLVFAVGLVLGVAWLLRRDRPGLLEASAISIPVILLASPASWAGYTLFLLPALFARTWTQAIWVSVVMLIAPFWLVRYGSELGFVGDILIGSIYAWATLLLLVIMIRERTGRKEQRPALAPAA
jgi:hypothetical protein